MPNLVTIECRQCRKPFADYKSNGRLFCSKACYWLSKQIKVALVCETCRKPFSTIPAEIKKAEKRGKGVRFCSRACWRAGNRGAGNASWRGGVRTVICDWCKIEFKRPLTHPKDGEHKFCSPECRKAFLRSDGANTPNWRGGVTAIHYGVRKSFVYKDWRKAVFERDNYTCQDCGGRGGKLHAHHVKSFSKHPDLRLEVSNGVTLCRACHQKHHKQKLTG